MRSQQPRRNALVFRASPHQRVFIVSERSKARADEILRLEVVGVVGLRDVHDRLGDISGRALRF